MIRYVKGDATAPEGDGAKMIVHVCNDMSAWGRGFVLALSKRWPEPERHYRRTKPILGEVQFVQVEPDLFVANMIAQRGFPSRERSQAVDYDALAQCLHDVADYCEIRGMSVHMPRIGCGIGGGTWSEVEPIVARAFGGFEVTVYDLP